MLEVSRAWDLTDRGHTSEVTGQDIADPRAARLLLCECVGEAQAILRTQLGPAAVPYRP